MEVGMQFRRFALILLFALLALAVALPQQVSMAQTNTCSALITQALSQTAVNCAGRETGTACYGFPSVESELTPDADPLDFDEPGESISLDQVIHLRPSEINLLEQEFGVVTMNVQANLPSGFAQDVVVIGLGGAEIEDGVFDSELFTPLDNPVSVTTSAAGELREATLFTDPASNRVLGNVPANTALPVDAVSSDGNWARVVYQNRPGWLAISALGGSVEGVPIYDGLTPMQKFYFRTGINGQPCADAPSLVVVQGPRDIPVDMVINGVDIRIESTMALRTLPSGEPVGRNMEIIAISGLVTINPGQVDQILLTPGFSVNVGLGPELVSLGIEGDEDERSVLSIGMPVRVSQTVRDLLGIIERIPQNILNYRIVLWIIVTPSGVGPIITRIVINDPNALTIVRGLCEEGIITPAICSAYGL